MIRIIDRFHPDPIASKSNDLVSMNDHLFKQSTPDSNKMMTNGNSFSPSKYAGTTLIEVPKKWTDLFLLPLNSHSSRSWTSSLLQSQFPSLILQPRELFAINMSSVPKCQLTEQCKTLELIHSSNVPEEALIMEEE
jgi:hypothetical protein